MKNTPSAESQVALDRHKALNPPRAASAGMVSDQGETSGVAAVAACSRLIAADRAVSKRWMTVPTRGTVFNHSERGEMVDLEYEEREWVCVFCKEPQRYVLINGYCEIGCGGAHHFYNGRRADYCSKPECRAAGERFLNGANHRIGQSEK